MNQNLRKTALLAGVCAVFGLFWSPQAKADSAVNTVQSVQQDRKVTGTVVDAMGPVIGASIMEKGTSNGTVTDLEGNFSLIHSALGKIKQGWSFGYSWFVWRLSFFYLH